MFFLIGIIVGERIGKKKQLPVDEKIEKEYTYYKNLSTGLLSDVSQLRTKNNKLLEENWKLNTEIKKANDKTSNNKRV